MLCCLAKQVAKRVLLLNCSMSIVVACTRYGGQLYLLVTDQGYAREANVVWEHLDRVDGDTTICGSDFRPYVAPAAEGAANVSAAAADMGPAGLPVDHGEAVKTLGPRPSIRSVKRAYPVTLVPFFELHVLFGV